MLPSCDVFHMKTIGVIGLGNPLRRDDGIGIILVERLQQQKKKLPKGIECIDGGTGGMNLLHLLARFDSAIIVDAVDFHGIPGESRVFTLEEIRSQKPDVRMSTHDSNFLHVLQLSKELQELPKTLVIFGVQPNDVSHGTGLSQKVSQNLNDLCLKLQKEIMVLVK